LHRADAVSERLERAQELAQERIGGPVQPQFVGDRARDLEGEPEVGRRLTGAGMPPQNDRPGTYI
jgi:hypothetical protein